LIVKFIVNNVKRSYTNTKYKFEKKIKTFKNKNIKSVLLKFKKNTKCFRKYGNRKYEI